MAHGLNREMQEETEILAQDSRERTGGLGARGTSDRGRVRGALASLASLLLGLAWLFFAFAKATTSEDVPQLLTRGASGQAAFGLIAIAVEGTLAILLLLAGSPARRGAAWGSAFWLVALGCAALWLRPAECHCAGSLVRIEQGTRLLIIGGLLGLSLVARSRGAASHGSAPPPWFDKVGVRACVAVGLAATLTVFLLGRSGREPPAIHGMAEGAVPQADADRAYPLLRGATDGSQRESGVRDPGSNTSKYDRGLRGRVVDEADEKPLAGAFVWSLSATEQPGGPTGALACTTEDGHFAIQVRTEGGPVRIGVLAMGYRPAIEAVDPSEEATVRLTRGSYVEGIVVDEAGVGVTGVRVEAWGVDGDEIRLPRDGVSSVAAFRRARAPDFGWTTSDAEGRFRINGLSDKGPFRLVPESERFVSPVKPSWPGTVFPREFVRIELRRLYVYRVRAVDAEDRHLLRSAKLEARGSTGLERCDDAIQRPSPRETDSDPVPGRGEKTILGGYGSSPPKAVQFWAAAPGYSSASIMVEPEPWPGTLHVVALARNPGADVRRLPVEARFTNGVGFTGDLLLLVSAQNGWPEFCLARLRDGVSESPLELDADRGPYDIRAEGAGQAGALWMSAGATSKGVDPRSDPAIRIALNGGRLRVAIRDDAGEPLRGFTVTVTAPGSVAIIEPWLWDRKAPGFQASDGTIDLWVRSGRTRLWVRKPGYGSVKGEVEIPADGGTQVFEARMNSK